MLYQFTVFLHLLFWSYFLVNHSNFEFQKMTTSSDILKHQMISAEEVMNIKVIELIKIYNFYFGHLFIRHSGSNVALNNVTTTMSDE